MRAFLVHLRMVRSKAVFWLLAVVAVAVTFWQQPWTVRGGYVRNQVISYDVAGYYAYLPMVFIEGDVRLEKPWKYDMIQLVGVHEHPESGGRHLKFTMGMAVLYAPFFAAAALSALNFLYGWLLLPESLPRSSRRASWPRLGPPAVRRPRPCGQRE